MSGPLQGHVPAWITRLGLWPRLIIAVTAGFLALYAVFSVLALRSVESSTDRILEERRVVAQMAAGEIGRLVERTFGQLEQTQAFAAFDPASRSFARERHMLEHVAGRIGGLSLGTAFLNRRGRALVAVPARTAAEVRAGAGHPFVARALRSGKRSVSAPFRDRRTGHPAVAVAVPVLDPGGRTRSLLVGLLDLGGREVLSPLAYARNLGRTGHAELVGPHGVAIVSTDGHFLEPGEHLGFYRRMLAGRRSRVETVAYTPPPGTRVADHEEHVMAFAPVSALPWGVVVGGEKGETFAPVTRLRDTLLLAGAAALAFLWLLTLIGARLLVQPVRSLTRAARDMAAGDLEQPVRTRAGGEIGELGNSIDAMRVQLRDSLEKLRRWSEELEIKVEERTAELSARNRQLAAVTAVATAASDAPDLHSLLDRSLGAVLEHTGMEAGVVRLLDGGDRLEVAAARGTLSCLDRSVTLRDCPCGVVPRGEALTALPLESPTGTLGVLCLARRERSPSREELQTLSSISKQIAVAVEKTRLLTELRRVEAQQEVQRLKAELLSAVSHELRTPLGIIKGYATTLLRDDLASLDAETQREFLQAIDEESEKLERMIDELLDVSRLQAGRLSMELERFELDELVAGTVAKLTPAFDNGEQAVEVHAGEQVLVLADPLRVEQVVRNLLENAALYSDGAAPVQVRVIVRDGHAEVSVADHGVGIAKGERESIFEPFHRGESSRGRRVRGTGLGLAISRGIVEGLGGSLWVESEPGAGSTFIFTLPLAGAERP